MPKSENREIVDACFMRLLDELGPELGPKAIKIIVDELGGLQIYVPSQRTLEIEARDIAIRADYYGKGLDYTSIAEIRGLKAREVRRIIHEKGG